ncbi:hypothetical protein K2Y11_02850 [bacterium]|nr:hypothetical protein [bacterium]
MSTIESGNHREYPSDVVYTPAVKKIETSCGNDASGRLFPPIGDGKVT